MKTLGLIVLGAIGTLIVAKLFPRLFILGLIVYGSLVYFRSISVGSGF
jgi:hypothetical protein